MFIKKLRTHLNSLNFTTIKMSSHGLLAIILIITSVIIQLVLSQQQFQQQPDGFGQNQNQQGGNFNQQGQGQNQNLRPNSTPVPPNMGPVQNIATPIIHSVNSGVYGVLEFGKDILRLPIGLLSTGQNIFTGMLNSWAYPQWVPPTRNPADLLEFLNSYSRPTQSTFNQGQGGNFNRFPNNNPNQQNLNQNVNRPNQG